MRLERRGGIAADSARAARMRRQTIRAATPARGCLTISLSALVTVVGTDGDLRTQGVVGARTLRRWPDPRDSLFYDLIRPQPQRLRDREAERLRRPEIDDELQLGGLLDGQIDRLRALQDLVDIRRGPPDEIGRVRVISHQAARLHHRPEG